MQAGGEDVQLFLFIMKGQPARNMREGRRTTMIELGFTGFKRESIEK